MLRAWFLHHENTQSVQTGIWTRTFGLVNLRANHHADDFCGSSFSESNIENALSRKICFLVLKPFARDQSIAGYQLVWLMANLLWRYVHST